MVTVDALKLLYKKLGGTANVDNITAISDMVDLIEDVAGGGGGGASGMVVNISQIMGTDNYKLDKNYTEITDSLDNGINPVFRLYNIDQTTTELITLLVIGSATVEDSTQYLLLLTGISSQTMYQFTSDSPTGELIGISQRQQ